MKIGMLWFDNSGRELRQRVKEAVEYYERKYGSRANVCFVPMSERVSEVNMNGVEIRSSDQILECHLWIGRAEG